MKDETSLLSEGMPIALQAARRVARLRHELDREDLESIARLTLLEIVPKYDPSRGAFRSFVAVHVGYALSRALRKERNAAFLSAEAAVRAGLDYLQSLDACEDALEGGDEHAYTRLNAIVSEAADVLALQRLDLAKTGQKLKDALSGLPPFQRDVVTLHYLEKKSFRQIATALGASLSRVYRAHQAALPVVRKSF